ncbi:MAG: hypothetical protein ONA90_09290, partial [candidate division KSB1 bacterium]|nr:hypothetical protein [candidate division KSB1 bacterium]
MNKRGLQLGVLLKFALASVSVFAQSMQIHVYGTGKGLPQSEVISIYQDRAGYMWFGTYESGLARYDGRSFQRLTLTGGIPNGAVHEIFQDRQDRMWIGTEEGLICLRSDPETGDTTVTVFTKDHGLPDEHVTSILQDERGVLWIGTEAGACYFDNKGFVPRLSQRSPNNNVILSMAL